MSTTFIDSVTAAMTAVALRWRVGGWLDPGWVGYGSCRQRNEGEGDGAYGGARWGSGASEGEADGVETLRR